MKRGNELLASSRFVEAETLFRDASTAKPDNFVFQSQLALSLIKQNQYEVINV